MKTIELMINGEKAQFTTKSVTLDGKEYFYSNITQLDHSPVVLTYRFEYDGEAKLLKYEKKDAKIMAAIFSQVHKMVEQNKEKAGSAAEENKQQKPADAEKNSVEATVEKAPEEKPAGESSEEKSAEEISGENAEEKSEDKKEKKSFKDFFKKMKSENNNDSDENKEDEKEEIDPEKKARLNKSYKIFGIIIAVVLVLSVAYYFVFGTSNDPSKVNPNNTESQQYEDIDQLIEDLQ